MDELKDVINALSQTMPSVMRWSGAIAKQLRQFNISLTGKTSGYSNTDALTLADITVQELLVSALRDASPILHTCRIEAEEENGDLHLFAMEGKYTIALDPIDGTKQFRDRTGDGYAVMMNLRCNKTVHYSLTYLPEMGTHGTWVEANSITGEIYCGEDSPHRTARELLDRLPDLDAEGRTDSKKIYLIGFLDRDEECAQAVSEIGLIGVPTDDMPGSIYPLMATGEFGGSLIHSPNIYDFPTSLQIARMRGGDAVMVETGEPVRFDDLWLDDLSGMLRVKGIVATAYNQTDLKKLVKISKNWNPERYPA